MRVFDKKNEHLSLADSTVYGPGEKKLARIFDRAAEPVARYVKNPYLCKEMKRPVAYVLILLLGLSALAAPDVCGQNRKFMTYTVEGTDTLFIDTITPSYVFTGRKKGRQWRKYYRLVHNFAKTYPYALQARDVVIEADRTIKEENLKRLKKERYVSGIQKSIFDNYESVIRKMTVSQGVLLIQLIGRETGLTPYEIIKDYKSGLTASFWQGVAKLFGGNLKRPYDPEQEDRAIEDLVKLWEAGEFRGVYFSIFGTDAPIPEVKAVNTSPSKKK